MKLNTVVCKPNLDDDMTKLVLELMPERWKIFEVLPVEGQNDGDVEELLLDNGEFQSWVDRHSFVEDYGIQFVPESNELMRGYMPCLMRLEDSIQMQEEVMSMAPQFWTWGY